MQACCSPDCVCATVSTYPEGADGKRVMQEGFRLVKGLG